MPQQGGNIAPPPPERDGGGERVLAGRPGNRRVTVAQAQATPIPPGSRSAPVLASGTLVARYYAPRGEDRQEPHSQDEVYVVIQGQGEFVNGGERVPFGPGDLLFVPAGVVHRFEHFSDDFATWVLFYGPEGGEGLAQQWGRE